MTVCDRAAADLPGVTSVQADITDGRAVQAVVGGVGPDAVVNVAAVADIDKAEANQVLARRVNVDGARHVAAACAAGAARHIFISSDAVFDGRHPPYREDDSPSPVNHYGLTKQLAEQTVRNAAPSSVILRLSLVLGFPVRTGNSYLASLESRLAAGESVRCPAHETRTPVDVHRLSDAILELAGGHWSGTLHLGATNAVGRYALARLAAQRLGYDPGLVAVQPEAGETGSGRAPRHSDGILCVDLAKSLLRTPLLNVEESLERAVALRPQTAAAVV